MGERKMTKWLQLKTLFLSGVIMVCLLTSGYGLVEQDSVSSGEKLAVYVDGVLEYTGYTMDGRAYVPLRSFCMALHMGAVVSQSRSGMVVRFTDPADDSRSCRLQAEVGNVYLHINDRVVYLGGEVLLRDGNVLVPMDGLCGAFDIVPVPVSDGYDLCIDGIGVISDGSAVYNEGDLKWLSHIIHAEAGNQSLMGQVCVGNVVLNRVRDSRFPDTVEEVVFSPNQFCPVKSGSIWCIPDEEAVVAAKLCLEGVNPAGESLYFVNPTTGSTRWFRENLTYVMSVGDHDFYC